MQQDQEYFANNPVAVVSLRALSMMMLAIALLRLESGDHQGAVAETCYSGTSFFFSRTLVQGNQHKVRDLMMAGTLLVSGLLIDSESFFPSFSQ